MVEWLAQNNWWLGLLLSIPLSILANLVTPRIQKWFDQRSSYRSHMRLADLRKELELITQLHNNRTMLYLDIARTMLRYMILGSLVIMSSLAATLAFMTVVQLDLADTSWLIRETHGLARIPIHSQADYLLYALLGRAFFAVTIVVISIICVDIVNYIRRINSIINIDSYRNSVEKRIEILEKKTI